MTKLVQRRASTASANSVRGAVRLVPPRRARAATALEPVVEPVELPQPAPWVDGSLALLETPLVERAPEMRPVPAHQHILIVEDDARTVDVLRSALELEGEPAWDIVSAGDGMHALELAARVPPDVVLLDVRLPGLDGAEVYRRLRASSRERQTRVLFLSAGTALDLAQRGINDGVLLRKPFHLPDLVALVRALLER